MRLEVDEVFSPNYEPKQWETNEMDAVVEFLALQNPTDNPEYLVCIMLVLCCCMIIVYKLCIKCAQCAAVFSSHVYVVPFI